MEIDDLPARNRGRSRSHGDLGLRRARNTWHIYSMPRGSQKVLGTTSYISDDLRRQVRRGQWGVSFFGFAASIFYFAGSNSDDIRYVGLALGAIAFMFLSMLYYKNISYAVVCRLFREENVVVVFLTSLGNLCIDIMQPSTTISPILGLLYLFCVNAFLFLDALKLKSRFFVLFIGSLFVVLTVHNIYGYTLLGWDKNVVLFTYQVSGESVAVENATAKRWMYFQMMLLSLRGLWTIFHDKEMELMMFATGPVYRETGTAKKDSDRPAFITWEPSKSQEELS